MRIPRYNTVRSVQMLEHRNHAGRWTTQYAMRPDGVWFWRVKWQRRCQWKLHTDPGNPWLMGSPVNSYAILPNWEVQW